MTIYNESHETFLDETQKPEYSDSETLQSVIDFDVTDMNILDLGCGDGADLLTLQERGVHVWGLDTSEEMIKTAQQKNPNGHFAVGTFKSTPYEDTFFDVVISKYAFQTAKDIDPIINEASRILKKGGYLIYIAVHPLRQFLEKKVSPKDYFKQEIVDSVLFDGALTVQEPSHTLNEYLSPLFFKHFELLSFEEKYTAGAEKINGDTYPGMFVIRAVRR